MHLVHWKRRRRQLRRYSWLIGKLGLHLRRLHLRRTNIVAWIVAGRRWSRQNVVACIAAHTGHAVGDRVRGRQHAGSGVRSAAGAAVELQQPRGPARLHQRILLVVVQVPATLQKPDTLHVVDLVQRKPRGLRPGLVLERVVVVVLVCQHQRDDQRLEDLGLRVHDGVGVLVLIYFHTDIMDAQQDRGFRQPRRIQHAL